MENQDIHPHAPFPRGIHFGNDDTTAPENTTPSTAGETKLARGSSTAAAAARLPSHNPRGTSIGVPLSSTNGGLGRGRGAEASLSKSFGDGTARPTKPTAKGRTRLTEGNIERQQAHRELTGYIAPIGSSGGAMLGGRVVGGFIGEKVGNRVAGKGEVGGLQRVRRYMETRHGERAARESRLNDVTRSLLQTL